MIPHRIPAVIRVFRCHTGAYMGEQKQNSKSTFILGIFKQMNRISKPLCHLHQAHQRTARQNHLPTPVQRMPQEVKTTPAIPEPKRQCLQALPQTLLHRNAVHMP
jgi:hypothetical protein